MSSKGSSQSNDIDLFEVDKIIDKKIKNKEVHYKVHWKGFGDEEDSWEPESFLGNCKKAIKE